MLRDPAPIVNAKPPPSAFVFDHATRSEVDCPSFSVPPDPSRTNHAEDKAMAKVSGDPPASFPWKVLGGHLMERGHPVHAVSTACRHSLAPPRRGREGRRGGSSRPM